MSISSEVTISPVLLQAISQTLTDKQRGAKRVKMQPTIQIKQEIIEGMAERRRAEVTAGHILQGMNVPVFEGAKPVSLVQVERTDENDQDHAGSKELENPSESPGDFIAGLSQEQIKNVIKWKLENQQNQLQGDTERLISGVAAPAGESSETILITSSASDMRMVNVLSAFASQHRKATATAASDGSTDTSHAVTQPVLSVPMMFKDSQINYKENKNSTGDAEEAAEKQHVIICYDDQGNASVPSPGNDVVVSESGQTVNVVIEQDGQRYFINDPNTDRVGDDSVKQARFEGGNLIISTSQINTTPSQTVGMDLTAQGSPTGAESLAPCPICGDGVSGYHYGIFTCESCKGFFKRTVQNKKTFACHHKGECDITKGSRKKCPACRFAKCIIMGMKLEAIRPDRMRGGRSSYDGCSPHGRPKSYLELKSIQKKPKAASPRTVKPTQNRMLPKASLENIHVTLPSGEDISGSQLMAMLNRNGKTVTEEVKPFVPNLLTEIMNVESYLCEDESSTDFPPERLSENDPSFMLSLLQLAELRLYKLVRWARNLPQFSAIATDDQILLLQNCWADLLLFNCCMRSIQSTTEIFLPMGKSIDMEKAEKLGHGADDIVSRMLAITEQLRRLQVDQYEFVALKVMMLITPDVKGLKEPIKAQENQENVCEALALYTNSHYPQHQNKFGEMLLRLPEISRVSMIGKEILNTVMPPEFTSCGLLFELLKGDGLKDDT